jgi:hypothetical protein
VRRGNLEPARADIDCLQWLVKFKMRREKALSCPQADLMISVEINADFPNGASDQIKRAVSENAKSLGFKTWTWE